MQPERPQGFNASQTPFVRQTYRLFLYGILGMVAMGVLGFNVLPAAAALPVLALDALIWIAVGWFGWRKPANVVLTLFTVITGLTMGILAHAYAAAVFIPAVVLTVAAFTGLTAYVHTTKKDFSYLAGFLVMAFWVLMLGSLLSLFLYIPFMATALSAFGVLTFGGWILFDTSRILQDQGRQMSPGEAATELLLDIVGLLRWLLDLLDRFR